MAIVIVTINQSIFWPNNGIAQQSIRRKEIFEAIAHNQCLRKPAIVKVLLAIRSANLIALKQSINLHNSMKKRTRHGLLRRIASILRTTDFVLPENISCERCFVFAEVDLVLLTIQLIASNALLRRLRLSNGLLLTINGSPAG